MSSFMTEQHGPSNKPTHILRQLGTSNLHISPIGLGCWQFSKGNGLVGKYWPALSNQTIVDIVQTSLQHGVNWFDTAEIYGKGESEKALARTLQQLNVPPSDAIIATKWWPVARTAGSIRDTIMQRLECLQPYPISLYQIHQPYALSSIRAQLEAMRDLITAGHIKYAGVSNFSAKQMEEAHQVLQQYGLSLISNQVKYSMIDRRIEKNGILDTAKRLDIAIIAYSPLEQGILTGKFHPQSTSDVGRELNRAKAQSTSVAPSGIRRWLPGFRQARLIKTWPLIEELQRLALEYEVEPGQVALNWLIHYHGHHVFAIPGASRSSQAAANAKVLTFHLSDSEKEHLNQLSMQVTL